MYYGGVHGLGTPLRKRLNQVCGDRNKRVGPEEQWWCPDTPDEHDNDQMRKSVF
tara:strand:+ start:219 stop:380 length:162 start_codon:yes stop_codon:yes gene_type:complete